MMLEVGEWGFTAVEEAGIYLKIMGNPYLMAIIGGLKTPQFSDSFIYIYIYIFISISVEIVGHQCMIRPNFTARAARHHRCHPV